MQRLFFVIGFISMAMVLNAQSNEFLDDLLAVENLTAGKAAYLVMVASENVSEDADEARAFELMQNMGYSPKNVEFSQPIRIRDYAFILMKAFDIKGSLMYRLFPSPRYAYRSLSAMQVIQGVKNPSDLFDGNAAIQILGRVFDIKGLN